MLLAIVLASLSGLSKGIRFYNDVGSISDEEISPVECFQGKLTFKCRHINACKKYIKGIEGVCGKLTLRNTAKKASMQQAQYDDPRRRAPVSGLANPYFVTELQNITVTEGDDVNLKCVASGSPVPRVSISSMRTYRKLRYSNRYRRRKTGFRDAYTEFTIFQIKTTNEGWYRCAAVNSHDYLISDGYVRVQADPCRNMVCGELEVCKIEGGQAKCVCPDIQTCSQAPVHPVCGNDCVSYFNDCTMKVQSCVSGQNISIWMDNSVCPNILEPSVNKNSRQLTVQAGASLRLKCGAQGYPYPEVAWYKVLRNGLEQVAEQDMFEVRDVETSQSGKYVCIATNCLVRSIRSNVVKVNVLEMRRSDRKVCHVFGDPHVTTFTGAMFSFVGECEYVLAMDCIRNPQWILYGTIAPCGLTSSCLESITVIAEQTAVQFLKGWIVSHEGTEVIIAPGGQITLGIIVISYDRDGLVYTIEIARYGIEVVWDGHSSATVIASKPRHTCGLCGSYGADAENSVERTWFSGFHNNVERMGGGESDESWTRGVDYSPSQCPRTVAKDGAPFPDTCLDEAARQVVEKECRSVLEGEEFSHCMHHDEQVSFYTRACIRDTCGHDSDRAFCDFLQSVKQHCERETQIPVKLYLDMCPDKAGRKIELIKRFL